jgi:predicted negative regulator of RcsB-dependent stress response
MGDVYRKSGNNREAREAYTRALRIYEALGSKSEEAETRKRIENVQ